MRYFVMMAMVILSVLSCNKENDEPCKEENNPFYGVYSFDDSSNLYFIEIKSNFSEAKKIISEDVEGNIYPICCQPNFSQAKGNICFSFRLAENTEIPINPGPGPSTNKYIKVLNFSEQ